MYRKDSTGWIKHVDFIILDLICLQVAFVLAYVLSGYGANPYKSHTKIQNCVWDVRRFILLTNLVTD